MNITAQAATPESSKGICIFWPKRIFGPQPSLREVNFICWAMFLAFLVVPICVVHWMQVKQGNGSYVQLNSDFVYFYGDGLIARDYPAARIYDYGLQQQTFNSIQPSRDESYGASPYPPFVPLFFSLLARLPFNAAYFLWLAISLGLYCVGIWAAVSAIFPGDQLKLSLILCFALAFYPFVAETLANGQLSAIAVFAVGLAIFQERRGNLFLGGLTLGLLCYKPTLLLLILPMLLLTKQLKILWGFLTGVFALLLIGTCYGGLPVWDAWIRLMRFLSHQAGVHGKSALKLQMYLDFSSVSHMVSGGRTAVGLAIVVALASVISATLAVVLWRSRKGPGPVQWLVWAAVLTWTLMLNVYVPIYDSVLVVLAVILTLGALRDLGWSKATEWVTFLAVLIFAVSWITEPVAKAHGIQLLTVALSILGSAQIYFLNRVNRQISGRESALG